MGGSQRVSTCDHEMRRVQHIQHPLLHTASLAPPHPRVAHPHIPPAPGPSLPTPEPSRPTPEPSLPPLPPPPPHLHLAPQMNGKDVPVSEYTRTEKLLTLTHVPHVSELEVHITTKVKPQDNSLLVGLYKSGGNFCTQVRDGRREGQVLMRGDGMGGGEREVWWQPRGASGSSSSRGAATLCL